MTEFRCIWQQCPHIHHEKVATFIEAPDEETARAVLKDYVQRKYGVGGWFTIHKVTEYTRPTGGRVLE